MKKSMIRIFFFFFLRDCKTYVQRFKNHIINFTCIYPPIFAFSIAYLQGQLYFGNNNTHMITISYVGTVVLTLLVLTYKLNIPLLFDLEGERYIDYQIVHLKPPLILLEKIIFSTLFSFVVFLPFFPMSILPLQTYFNTTNTSWSAVVFMLFLGALFCSTYSCFMACALPNKHKIGMMWRRINFPLLLLGGYLTPWYVINTFSPRLATIVLCNPFMYFTEGIRSAFLGGNQFFSILRCSIILSGFSLLFFSASCYFFKKRTDHL